MERRNFLSSCVGVGLGLLGLGGAAATEKVVYSRLAHFTRNSSRILEGVNPNYWVKVVSGPGGLSKVSIVHTNQIPGMHKCLP